MENCSLITDITNVVVAIAAIAGAVIAALGLWTWRHELHGRADFELARRVMRGAYELRNQIRQMRNIFLPDMLDTQYERLNNKASEIDVALLETEVLWGNALHGQKQSLKECLVNYRLALRRHVRSQRKERTLTDQQHEEIDAILFGDGGESDQFGVALDQAVRGFEDALRPYLKRRTR